MQVAIEHAAWIDNIPWYVALSSHLAYLAHTCTRPGVRDILIENPNDHTFDIFSQYYSQNVSINWSFESSDAVNDANNEVFLHSIFEKHICNLENWTVTPEFQARFPHMTAAIYARDKG